MMLYVTIGGMKGTTWVQMVKAVLLIAGTLLITFLVLLKFNFNVSDLLGEAAENSGMGTAFLEPGLKYGVNATSKLDFLSLGIALVLGTAGLPHILIRFYTVPTAQAARKSVNWAIGIIGGFYLMTIALGFGAAALLDHDAIIASNKSGNTAAPLLAEEIGGGADSTGGAILLAVISAVAFATILAVVAGLTLALVVLRPRPVRQRDPQGPGDPEAGDGRGRATVGIGTVAVVLAFPARDLNVAGLVALAFAVAASANLPTILYSLFWKRFTTRAPSGHLRRAHLLRLPGALLPRRLRQADLDVPGRRLPLVPAGEPRPDLHPAGLPLRDTRHAAQQGHRQPGPLPRARGPLAHRGRRRRRAVAPQETAEQSAPPRLVWCGLGRIAVCRVVQDQRELLDVESVAGHLLPAGSVFAFLAEHRQRLFPAEMFDGSVSRRGGAGRRCRRMWSRR